MSSDHQRLQCMNVWGGNQVANTSLTTAGLDIWMSASPYQHAESGGDIYQISSCSSGSISRILLADVSGHGFKVSDIAVKLRSIMHNHINEINQKRVVSEINREFTEWEGSDAFATAVVCTFFAPTKKMSLCNAGHPCPCIFRSKSQTWEILLPKAMEDERNLPLGVFPDNKFSGLETKLGTGDMVLLYTDALPESKNEQGKQLNEAGLLELLNRMPRTAPELLLSKLIQSIKQMNSHNLENDDATFILIQANGTRGRFRDFAAAPYRMIKNIFAPKSYA